MHYAATCAYLAVDIRGDKYTSTSRGYVLYIARHMHCSYSYYVCCVALYIGHIGHNITFT